MTTTNETRNATRLNLLMSIGLISFVMALAICLSFWAIIANFLTQLSALTIMGLTIFGALATIGAIGGLIYWTVNGALNTTKKAIDTGFHVAFLKEELNMKRANTQYRMAETTKVMGEAQAMQYQICEVSQTKGAMVLVNGQVTSYLPPQPNQALLSAGQTDLETNTDKLFEVFRTAKSIHALLMASRNGGKSTLLNRLMNEEFQGADITIIDPIYNRVMSGWLLPKTAKVTRDFIGGLTAFYQSHKAIADNETTKRVTNRKVLVIDEAPSLLKELKATDKKQYDIVMAMLRSIYSQGSHTEHNLILLSQTALSEDLDLSSNDKGNFIQVALGSLAGDYLALRRGKSGKKGLYERLAAIAHDHDFYAVFEDFKGVIDVQPLPDLSAYGAKRLYDQGDSEAMPNEPDQTAIETVEKSPMKLSFLEVTDYEQKVIDATKELVTHGKFSFNKLHFALTGQKQSGGKQNDAYREILAKFDLLSSVEVSST